MMLAGVLINASMGRASGVPTRVMAAPMMMARVMAVFVTVLSPCSSFAPKVWLMTICAPMDTPMNSALKSIMIGKTAPTAASASVPT